NNVMFKVRYHRPDGLGHDGLIDVTIWLVLLIKSEPCVLLIELLPFRRHCFDSLLLKVYGFVEVAPFPISCRQVARITPMLPTIKLARSFCVMDGFFAVA